MSYLVGGLMLVMGTCVVIFSRRIATAQDTRTDELLGRTRGRDSGPRVRASTVWTVRVVGVLLMAVGTGGVTGLLDD